MTFLVVLIALLIERFLNCSHLRNWHWYSFRERFIEKKLPNSSPYLQLALVWLPPAIVVGIVQLLLRGWLHESILFLFELAIVIYCIGPRNLWVDSTVKTPISDDASTLPEPAFLGHVFVQANSRVFGLIFWYAIFGPVAAVLYRTITMLALEPAEGNTCVYGALAKKVHAIIDWIPVRVFTFGFSLAGHFVRTLAVWRKQVKLPPENNEIILIDCGLAALGSEADVAMDKSAISLVDRVFVITLVVIALLSFVV